MIRRSLRAALNTRNLWAQLDLLRDTQSYVRIQFLHAAMASGLVEAMPRAATRDELIERMGVCRPELLDALLALGVFLRELGGDGRRFRLKGRRIRAMARVPHIAAMVHEFVEYHGSVYRELPARLRGAELGAYLDQYGTVIAQASRVFEPFQAEFVREVVPPQGPVRMLEVGCGSGVYLRHAAAANAQLTGVAIDLDDNVVEEARKNLQDWGVGPRFQVSRADVRELPPEIAGPFGLVTLYNNIYYFQPEERPALLRILHGLLGPNGRFALVTTVLGDGLGARDLDLALRSTIGCTALPSREEIESLLRDAGFREVTASKLMPLEPFYGFVARR